jgi:hypothetical protein
MSMSGKTVDFGAPAEFGLHHFYVDIPVSTHEAVRIYEYFGFDGEEARRETEECRLVLARELWTKIRDEARRDFNTRLKIRKLSTGSWRTGKIRLDRFLGRELCVLGWAAEHASVEQCAVIGQKWLAMRPEERWWLYSKTAAEAGLEQHTDRGWRKALYCALSDGTNIKLGTRAKPKTKDKQPARTEEPLQYEFDFIEKGDI